MARPRLLYLVTEDWFFLSYRKNLACAARDVGFEVVVATRVDKMGEAIAAEELTLEPLTWIRGSVNPVRLLADLVRIIRLYRRLRPDLVHHVSLKPIVLGSLAALFTPKLVVVNSLSGLGHTFTAQTLRERLLARAVSVLLAPLLRLRKTVTIVENEDNRRFLTETLRVPATQVVNLGAGIDLTRFPLMPGPSPPGTEPVTVACVARMLVIKGIGDLVAAGRILRERGVPHHVVLAGGADPENPGSIPVAMLEGWVAREGVEWLGQVSDTREVWRRADIAVQPSLGGEGLPRSLVEAAACGRALVATDVPGCRDVARADVNGLLVAPGQPAALADAIERLIRDASLRARFAAASRRIALADFSLERLLARTIALYDTLLGRGKG